MNLFIIILLCSTIIATTQASICCVPPQWEGRVGFLVGMLRNGKPYYLRGSSLMAYDGVRRLIGQKESVEIGIPGKSINIDVLLDFNNNTKWIRQGNWCIKTKLNRLWQDACIPDNATVVSLNADLGSGSNRITVDSYSIMFGGGLQATLSVLSHGQCIPVLESYRGILDGARFMQNVGYVNISAGLSDPNELKSPPTGCENALLVEGHYTQGTFTPGIGRRSIFGLF